MLDFDLRLEARGLVMELRTASGVDSLVIPEDAFGFVEPCVSASWPSYASHGHWGRTTIPPAAWRKIVDSMRALRDSLASSRQLSDVSGIGFLFDHLRSEFSSDFEANKAGLIRLIDTMCEWIEIWIARCVDITIVGV
jgi:hypothetical protein